MGRAVERLAEKVALAIQVKAYLKRSPSGHIESVVAHERTGAPAAPPGITPLKPLGPPPAGAVAPAPVKPPTPVRKAPEPRAAPPKKAEASFDHEPHERLKGLSGAWDEWTASKPWDQPSSQLNDPRLKVVGQREGIRSAAGAALGNVAGTWQGDHIRIGGQAWDEAEPDTRRFLLGHEASHAAAADILANVPHDEREAMLEPFKSTSGGYSESALHVKDDMFARTPEEMLADTGAAILTFGPDVLQQRYENEKKYDIGATPPDPRLVKLFSTVAASLRRVGLLSDETKFSNVQLARTYVGPYLRVGEHGQIERVDPYWRTYEPGGLLPTPSTRVAPTPVREAPEPRVDPLEGLTIEEHADSVIGPRRMSIVAKDASGKEVAEIWWNRRGRREALVVSVFVDPEYRRRGVGTALAAELHERNGRSLIHGHFSSPEGVRFGVTLTQRHPEWNKLWLDGDDPNPRFWDGSTPLTGRESTFMLMRGPKIAPVLEELGVSADTPGGLLPTATAPPVRQPTRVPGLVTEPRAGGWIVVHEGSGKPLSTRAFATRKDARAVADSLATVTDWTQPSDVVSRPEVAQATVQAYARAPDPAREAYTKAAEAAAERRTGPEAIEIGDTIEFEDSHNRGTRLQGVVRRIYQTNAKVHKKDPNDFTTWYEVELPGGGITQTSEKTSRYENRPEQSTTLVEPGRRLASVHQLPTALPAAVPPLPGEAPIPEGHVRLFHVTPLRNAESVRERGLTKQEARGESYGEPNQVWASAGINSEQAKRVIDGGLMDSDFAVVEFHADPAKLDIGSGREPASLEARSSDVTMLGDVPPGDIVAVHEPWHSAYRYLSDYRAEVVAGEYDYAAEDNENYARAIEAIKREAGDAGWVGFPFDPRKQEAPRPADVAPERTASGSFVLYHGTSPEAAARIKAEGRLRPDDLSTVGVSTTPGDARVYGLMKSGPDAVVLRVEVTPEQLSDVVASHEIGGRGRNQFLLQPPTRLKDWSGVEVTVHTDPLEGLPIRENPNLDNEATARGDHIEVGPKFKELSPENQRHMLVHESAHLHGLDDAFLESGADWDLKSKIDVGHLNGQTTPGEIVAEAYAILWDEPGFLDEHAPEIRDLVTDLAKQKGLPVPDTLQSRAREALKRVPAEANVGADEVPDWEGLSSSQPPTGAPGSVVLHDTSGGEAFFQRVANAYDDQGRLVSTVQADIAKVATGRLQPGQVKALYVATRPDARRQGHATKLYDALRESGLDIVPAVGQTGVSEEGSAFTRSYLRGLTDETPHLLVSGATKEDLAKQLDGFEIRFSNSGISNYLIVHDPKEYGQEVGYIDYGVSGDGSININAIYVDPQYRKKGIAVGMLAALHEQFDRPLDHGSFASPQGAQLGFFMASHYPEWNKVWLRFEKEDPSAPQTSRYLKPVYWSPGDPVTGEETTFDVMPYGSPKERVLQAIARGLKGAPAPKPPEPRQFATVKDAEDHVRERYGYADFTGMEDEDLPALSRVIAEVDRIADEFPQVTNGTLSDIGGKESPWRFQGIGTIDVAPPNVREGPGGMLDSEGNVRAWGATRNTRGGPRIWLSTGESFRQGTGQMGVIGFTFERTPEEAMVHEMGHVMQSITPGSERQWSYTVDRVWPWTPSSKRGPKVSISKDIAIYADRSFEGFASLFSVMNIRGGLERLTPAARRRVIAAAAEMNEAAAERKKGAKVV